MFILSRSWDKEKNILPHMTLSTLLILAERRTHVIHEPSLWPNLWNCYFIIFYNYTRLLPSDLSLET